jgi:hypothetical protein
MRSRTRTVVFAVVLAVVMLFPFGSWALDFAGVAVVSILGGVVIGQRQAVRVALGTTAAVQLFTWAALLLLFVRVRPGHTRYLTLVAAILGPVLVGTACAALGVWLRRRSSASPAISN